MYKVTLPREFPYEQRVRAGIVVNKVHGYEGELTGDQLKAIKADGIFTVQKIQSEADKKAELEAKAKAAEEAAAKEAEAKLAEEKAAAEAEAKVAAEKGR